jgi:threonine aldolase
MTAGLPDEAGPTIMIELRSDTFTLPTRAMLDAMTRAPLGNDVYREDPTVYRLEELVAQKLGKEAACLTPSGTMANLTSVLAQVARGQKLLVSDESDLYRHESGGASICGGAIYEPIPTQPDGRMLIADLAAGFPDDPHDPEFAPASLICLENTHNRCGGRVLPLTYLREVREFADSAGLPVHLDGARLFNAAVALDVSPARIAAFADSVQVCLSKGLSAPVGSVAAGTTAHIERVRRLRKMLGGGMRQAGVVAAAGIVALEQMVERLAEDHDHARLLAFGLAELPGIEIDPGSVQTNIVMFRTTPARLTHQDLIRAAAAEGLALSELAGKVRAVTHAGVTRAGIDRALAIIARIVHDAVAPVKPAAASSPRS